MLKESRKFFEERRKMPVRKSKGGYQFGTKGKVYKGKGAKKKASKQGRAIQASKRKRALGK
jgi:hypothetical protein